MSWVALGHCHVHRRVCYYLNYASAFRNRPLSRIQKDQYIEQPMLLQGKRWRGARKELRQINKGKATDTGWNAPLNLWQILPSIHFKWLAVKQQKQNKTTMVNIRIRHSDTVLRQSEQDDLVSSRSCMDSDNKERKKKNHKDVKGDGSRDEEESKPKPKPKPNFEQRETLPFPEEPGEWLKIASLDRKAFDSCQRGTRTENSLFLPPIPSFRERRWRSQN